MLQLITIFPLLSVFLFPSGQKMNQSHMASLDRLYMFPALITAQHFMSSALPLSSYVIFQISVITHMWNLKTKQMNGQTKSRISYIYEGLGKMGEGETEVHVSSYEVNMLWG